MEDILREVLQKIKPTVEERKIIYNTVKNLEKRIREELINLNLNNVEIKLVGSVAKDTFLKGDVDIDFFLLFPHKYPKEILMKTTLAVGKKILDKYEEKYAQHPYASGVFEGFNVDIVPSYKIDSAKDLKTAVDRTQLHTEYVKKNLKEEKKDDVRLLKAFMKGVGVYGAEVKTGGFSGYLCELLVIKYGGFIEVLKNASKWKKNTFIYIGEKPTKRFEKSPLVFVDPVDSNRNAAAAVRENSYYKFILAANNFIKEPSIKYFFPNEEKGNIEDIERYIRNTSFKIYCVLAPKPNVVDEVLYSQIQKFCKVIYTILDRWTFIPHNIFYVISSKKVYIIFTVERDILPSAKIHEGPPVWTNNAIDFVKKWSKEGIEGPFIKNYRVCAVVKRKYTHLDEIIKNELKDRDIGKYFNKIKDKIDILPLEKILEKIESQTIKDIYRGLVRKLPWTV